MISYPELSCGTSYVGVQFKDIINILAEFSLPKIIVEARITLGGGYSVVSEKSGTYIRYDWNPYNFIGNFCQSIFTGKAVT